MYLINFIALWRTLAVISLKKMHTLLLIIKEYSISAVPLSSQLLHDDILKAAKDLNKLTAGIEDYNFIERDVQHFADLQGKKYTLSVVIRLYDLSNQQPCINFFIQLVYRALGVSLITKSYVSCSSFHISS